MGFYEDDRIRQKNKPVDEQPTGQHINLVVDDRRSLAEVLEILRNGKFRVTLIGTNTIVIE